jgi:tetratricopeptide (TPR) repeat protein
VHLVSLARSVAAGLLLAGSTPVVASSQDADSVAAAAVHRRGADGLREARYEDALVAFTEAARLRGVLGDSAGLASSLNSLGAAHYQLGQYELALEHQLRSLAIRRAIHDSIGIARVLSNVGRNYQDQRLLDRALPALREAVAIAERAGDPLVLGYALNSFGTLMSELGAHAEARAFIERAQVAYAAGETRTGPLAPNVEAVPGWAFNLTAMSRVHVKAGDPGLAIPLLDSVIEFSVRANSVRGESQARLVRGQAYAAQGRTQKAIEEFTRAYDLARGVSQRLLMLEALQELAVLEERSGRPAAALARLRAAEVLRDSLFDRSATQRIVAMESRMESERQQRENARLLEERASREALITRQRIVVVLGSLVLLLAGVVVGLLIRNDRRARARQVEMAAANAGLQAALAEVRTLSGFIPICANCKNVRGDRGFWEAVETYVTDRSHAQFSHSICPECGPQLYGDDWHAVEHDGGGHAPA